MLPALRSSWLLAVLLGSASPVLPAQPGPPPAVRRLAPDEPCPPGHREQHSALWGRLAWPLLRPPNPSADPPRARSAPPRLTLPPEIFCTPTPSILPYRLPPPPAVTDES